MHFRRQQLALLILLVIPYGLTVTCGVSFSAEPNYDGHSAKHKFDAQASGSWLFQNPTCLHHELVSSASSLRTILNGVAGHFYDETVTYDDNSQRFNVVRDFQDRQPDQTGYDSPPCPAHTPCSPLPSHESEN